MRTVIQKHRAVNAPIADLVTYRAIPTQSVEYIDPFLFLNHHGPQVYRANNRGLPFGPHPHRGFETVTHLFSKATFCIRTAAATKASLRPVVFSG
jgi:redox-sensitive bicupin YhaK (pirin superfamily)